MSKLLYVCTNYLYVKGNSTCMYKYIDVAQLVEHRTGTLLTRVRFPGAARDFSPRVNFQCRLSYGVPTPPCAIACIYIRAHVRLITETLKHPVSIPRLGSATLLLLAFPGEGNPNFSWE